MSEKETHADFHPEKETIDEIFNDLHASNNGLTQEQAESRLKNTVLMNLKKKKSILFLNFSKTFGGLFRG